MAWAGLAGPTLAQKLGHADNLEISWWRFASALIVCLVLAVLGALALRARLRTGRAVTAGALWPALAGLLAPAAARAAPGPRRLQLVETLRLGHQVEVCLVECDEEGFLIATSPHGAVVVAAGSGLGRRPAPA